MFMMKLWSGSIISVEHWTASLQLKEKKIVIKLVEMDEKKRDFYAI